MPIPLGILAQFRQAAAGDFVLLETQVLGSTTASVTFSNLATYASTYKHLQIRVVGRVSALNNDGRFAFLRFNSDSGNNYSNHGLFGQNGSVASYFGADTGVYLQRFDSDGNTANAFGVSIIDILDPFVTTKNTTVRTLGGRTAAEAGIYLTSGLWLNTAALTSALITPANGSWVTGSRFSIYGIRG